MCRRAGIVFAAWIAASLGLQIPVYAAGTDNRAAYDLPAEPLGKALRDFAIQAHCNISYVPEMVAGLRAPAIKGEYQRAAVLAIMLAGTRLTAINIDDDTIQVVEAAGASKNPPTQKSAAADGKSVLHVASDNVEDQPPRSNTPAGDTGESIDRRDNELQEITVTGTHIRGVKNLASPVEIYTQADIDASGATTVQQFLQMLPQNFGGGASENTISQVTGGGQINNAVNGSAPNLRGLGADATLVLINGHRVAPGNIDGSFVDISMIPLTAVERIEVVTDGASAIYGSDAVGGVVNFILRRNFDGAETRAQYGSVSDGSKHDVQAGQTVGTDWGSGSSVLSYQYFDQTPLSAGSRNYLKDVPLPFDLLPEQVQNAAFANISQHITSDVELHGDLIYSHRFTDNSVTIGNSEAGFETQVSPSRIDGYGATLGSTVRLPRQSQLDISGTYSESDTLQQLFQSPGTPLLQVSQKTKAAIVSLDANLDGTLASIPGGPVRYAIGAQHRTESFGNTDLIPATENGSFYSRRHVDAGYAELHVPVVGPSGVGGGDPRVDLTVADRAEHYSDFGSTNNPQFGAIWKSYDDLTFRGTYGTSFKAPLLSELNPIPAQVTPIPAEIFNPAPGGTLNTLIVYGGNPDLKPEKATSWTVGADFKPAQIAGFSAKLTYYHIVFRDQIATAGESICLCNAYVDAGILGPTILNRSPTSAQIAQLVSEPTYDNFFNLNPATIGAILDSRTLNLSTVKTQGLDFRFAYKRPLLGAQIEAGLDGTYIFSFEDQFTSEAPLTSFRSTPYNPVDLRMRARAIVTYGPLTTGLYLNFTNSYSNNQVTPEEHVASWTTVDAIVSYELGSAVTALHGVSMSFSVLNFTDRDPPYVANLNFPITYDGANANALGRYFSIRVQKRW
jgi:outer membrane receptor protein involved in Fe transport